MGQGADLFRLDGRVALVVGAGRGIGRACALGLADFGARVVCADVNVAGADETRAAIQSAGGEAESLAVDITSLDSVQGLAERVGTPDVLVSTPSINVRKPLLELAEEEFDRVVNLNLKGQFRVLQTFGRLMAARGRGSMIVYSSIRAQTVEPGQGVYAATKAGTVLLVRTLAAELGPRGVRVNAIAPGVVETELTTQIRSQPEWHRAYAEKNALGRWAQPSEMVGATVFLASDAGSYVTGSYLLVDAGWTAMDGRYTPPL
jgi:NAD(P)-dependent dehydrogenase (short-subunit alcohol dehydrogenase family)